MGRSRLKWYIPDVTANGAVQEIEPPISSGSNAFVARIAAQGCQPSTYLARGDAFPHNQATLTINIYVSTHDLVETAIYDDAFKGSEFHVYEFDNFKSRGRKSTAEITAAFSAAHFPKVGKYGLKVRLRLSASTITALSKMALWATSANSLTFKSGTLVWSDVRTV